MLPHFSSLFLGNEGWKIKLIVGINTPECPKIIGRRRQCSAYVPLISNRSAYIRSSWKSRRSSRLFEASKDRDSRARMRRRIRRIIYASRIIRRQWIHNTTMEAHPSLPFSLSFSLSFSLALDERRRGKSSSGQLLRGGWHSRAAPFLGSVFYVDEPR